MPIPIAGQVGPQQVSDGVGTQPLRQGKASELIVTELQARYYEQVYRGNVFFAFGLAITMTAAALNTTSASGLLISNPSNSTKQLVPLFGEFALTAVVANTNTLLQVGAVVMPYSASAITNTTGANIYNALGPKTVGSGTVATGSSNWQLPVAPVLFKAMGSYAVTSTTYAGAPLAMAPYVVDFGGSVIIPPGCAFGISGTLADTANFTMTWMELPQ